MSKTFIFNPYAKIQNTAKYAVAYGVGETDVSRTIKAQYYKVGMANFVRQDSLGATAVIEIE